MKSFALAIRQPFGPFFCTRTDLKLTKYLEELPTDIKHIILHRLQSNPLMCENRPTKKLCQSTLRVHCDNNNFPKEGNPKPKKVKSADEEPRYVCELATQGTANTSRMTRSLMLSNLSEHEVFVRRSKMIRSRFKMSRVRILEEGLARIQLHASIGGRL